MNTNDIKLDFEGARTKHLAFKSNLRSFLYGLGTDEMPLRHAAACGVGKWLYGHALKTYGHLPQMSELERVHSSIHEKAGELIDLYQEGKVNAARAGLATVESIAERLVVLLGEVEKAIATRIDGSAGETTNEDVEELVRSNRELASLIREHSDVALKDRALLYEVLMQLPAHISLLLGPDFVFELVNPQALAVIAGKNVIGKSVKDAFPEFVDQGFVALLDRVYRGGEPYVAKELPARLRNDDGSFQEYFVDVTYLPFRDGNGSIIGVISFSYDVTDAVLARRRIQESEERFRFMADAMPNQAWTARADGALNYVNERTTRYFGKTAEEIVGEGWQHVVHPTDLPVAIEAWTHSLQTLEPYRAEFRLLQHDGSYRWHLAQANPFKGSGGDVTWYGSNTDIHELKELQDRLQQSYDDLEVKVRFRNLELERQNLELKEKLAQK